MLKNIAYVVMTSGLLLTSLTASAMPGTDSPFPKDNSVDYSINVAMSDTKSGPFPKDNSIDYSINVAMSDTKTGPFPKDNSIDNSINVAMSDTKADSPFPKDNSVDALPAQPVILA